MIKITFLIRSLDYGGTQRQLINLARKLDRNRFRISVLPFYGGQPLEGELAGSGVRLISLQKRGRWDLFGFLYRLIRQVRLIRPDVLHGYLDVPNLLTLLLKPFVSTRVVWGLRASEIDLQHYDWLRRMAASLERQFSAFPDLIIVNSRAAYERHINKGYPANKLRMIPNGIDTGLFRPDRDSGERLRVESGLSKETKLIGMVGRLDPVKGWRVFLAAAALLHAEAEDLRFLCVGEGPRHSVMELQVLAQNLGIADRVVILGARADMTAVYNALDLVVSASYAESFPNVIGEAMACGVPCVATNVGDSALIIGDTGKIVPPGDAQALAAAILSSLQADRRELGRRSRQRIVENFSLEQLAQRTEEALLSLINSS